MTRTPFAIGLVASFAFGFYIWSQMPDVSGERASQLILASAQVSGVVAGVAIGVVLVVVELSGRRTLRNVTSAVTESRPFVVAVVGVLATSLAVAGPVAAPQLSLPLVGAVPPKDIASFLVSLNVGIVALLPAFLLNLSSLAPGVRLPRLRARATEAMSHSRAEELNSHIDDFVGIAAFAFDGHDTSTARAALEEIKGLAIQGLGTDTSTWPEKWSDPFDLALSGLVRVAFDVQANSRAALLVIQELVDLGVSVIDPGALQDAGFHEEDVKRLSFALARLSRPSLHGDAGERQRQVVVGYMRLIEVASRRQGAPSSQLVNDLHGVVGKPGLVEFETASEYLKRVPQALENQFSENGSRRARVNLVRNLGITNQLWFAEVPDHAPFLNAWRASISVAERKRDEGLLRQMAHELRWIIDGPMDSASRGVLDGYRAAYARLPRI